MKKEISPEITEVLNKLVHAIVRYMIQKNMVASLKEGLQSIDIIKELEELRLCKNELNEAADNVIKLSAPGASYGFSNGIEISISYGSPTLVYMINGKIIFTKTYTK